MGQRPYKYMREDFGELPVDLEHLDIHLCFHRDKVEASCTMRMTARQRLHTLELDARDLEIREVELVSGAADEDGVPLEYAYDGQAAKLTVRLPEAARPGRVFRIRTRTVCRPNETVLEGIYKDITPPGAPQQFMSQCQQWGFQRIMPILDDCRAKCTMRTTLEADAAYTHLISNGNVNRNTNRTGRPRAVAGNPARSQITYDNNVPMAPYLFIAAVGTWDELAGEAVMPSGRKVRLEYLVPPGAAADAAIPLAICQEAVTWMCRTQDYEYPADTYRTITMGRSNFGGMENVGNTTIVTDAALIDGQHTLDDMLLYAHAVIVHEFEHNQCGSETTMATPFDVWLNEAYTVDVERQFMAEAFDAGFMRLREVDSMRNPLLGPLALEDGGRVGRIVREGFNDPDELIDGVTYVKAAEVIGMLRLILGREAFLAGKTLYFSRYKDANADSDQFFACFEEASGRDLSQFKAQWLHTIGYPKVTAATEWDQEAGRCTVRLRQDHPAEAGPFHLPVAMALVDGQGRDIAGTARVVEMTGPEAETVFEGLGEPPAFASLNRGCSFYGSFEHDASDEELARQARLDSDAVARVEAMRRLTERQRARLLHDPDAPVDQTWLELWGRLLEQPGVPAAVRAYLLRIEQQPLERRYLTWHRAQVAARDRLVAEVMAAHGERVLEAWRALDTYGPRQSPKDGIEDRLLKGTLLELIASVDSVASHKAILEQWREAATAQDRVTALVWLNRSSAACRDEVLAEAYRGWHKHLSGYANYLRVVSTGWRPDVFEMIEREQARESFDITNPTWCRSLFVPMAANTRMLWTERGVPWLAGKIIQLARVNTTTASRMLNAFQQAARLREPWRALVAAELARIQAEVSAEANPTIHGQASAYLEAARA